jgi:2-amino-4-hydroxy-6-hydroxymethyldihydropteridine diphosphokinase
VKVGLGLGSNLGDRLRNLQRARDYLVSLSVEGWHRQSPVYETDPVDCPPNSPKFLNAVLEIEFGGAPRTLLQKTQAYEVAHGRYRTLPVNSAREIDIDILYFGEREVLTKHLVIPHPRLAARRFVLLPLSTLAPDRIIKGTGKTVRQLLRELPVGRETVTFWQADW